MFEHKSQKLLPWPKFVRRMALWFLLAFGVVAAALAIGVLGYHYIARLAWIDAVLNAAMILDGMGPVATMEGAPAKLFASAYALFSGVVFLSAMSIVLAPVFHRVLHHFHWGEEDERADSK
jgi:hypothetical protein